LIEKWGILTEYAKAYRAAFDFHKRWMPCPSDPEEWNAAAREVLTVANQGGNDPFLIDLLGAVYSELERQYKERQEEEKCV
jgi:hypothetical protein